MKAAMACIQPGFPLLGKREYLVEVSFRWLAGSKFCLFLSFVPFPVFVLPTMHHIISLIVLPSYIVTRRTSLPLLGFNIVFRS